MVFGSILLSWLGYIPVLPVLNELESMMVIQARYTSEIYLQNVQ